MLAQGGVQRCQRLIQQNGPGPHRQRTGERHPLALAAGQLVDGAMSQGIDAHHLQHLAGAGEALGLGHAPHPQAIGHVLHHRHVGEQGIGLEHHTHIALLNGLCGDVLGIEAHHAAGIGRLQPGDNAQGGGLAAAGGAKQHHGLAGGNGQIHRLQGARAIGEGLAATAERDGGAARGWGNGCSHGRDFRAWALRVPPSIWMAISSGTIMMKKTSV